MERFIPADVWILNGIYGICCTCGTYGTSRTCGTSHSWSLTALKALITLTALIHYYLLRWWSTSLVPHTPTSLQYCISTTCNFTPTDGLHFCQSIFIEEIYPEYWTVVSIITITTIKITPSEKNIFFYFQLISGIMDCRVNDLDIFLVQLSINLREEWRLLLTSWNFAINVYDSLTIEPGIMDTELLIYFAFDCKINLNIYRFFSLIFLHFLQGNTDMIVLSPVLVKSNYLEIQYWNIVEDVPSGAGLSKLL